MYRGIMSYSLVFTFKIQMTNRKLLNSRIPLPSCHTSYSKSQVILQMLTSRIHTRVHALARGTNIHK